MKGRKGKDIMRRFLMLLIAGLLGTALCACAGAPVGTEKVSKISPVLDRIRTSGELRVGTSGKQPPLSVFDKEGKIIGMDADLAAGMAKAMGVKLRMVPLPFSDLLSHLQAGDVDIVLSSMTMTPQRNLSVAFAGPYFISGKAILSKRKTWGDIKDAEEINSPDTKLAALKGSTSQIFVEQAIPKATLLATKDYDEAVSLVLEGKVDALVADYPICIITLIRNPDKGLISLVAPLTYEPLGVAMPAGDPLMVNWMENFLKAQHGSGELERLKGKWFDDTSWLSAIP